ncbi:unnamed protein product [Rhodiola kirilowii]
MASDGDMRIRIEDEVDMISELPVHLREHILDGVSIKDAVATSVLSSKWRYCWTGLRKLNFNRDFWHYCRDNELVEHLKHSRAVDRILMLHSGPIREFNLFITEIEDKTLDINMWLRVLSKNGVQKIEIDAVDVEYQDSFFGCFPIPSCLFHCRELEKLSLRFCKLTLPIDFKGFANLTSLSLYHVEIASSTLESLIYGCLLLETLSIEVMLLQNPFALEALNLKTFYFNGVESEFIIFKENPKLTCVSLLAMDQPERIDDPQPYNTLERLCSFSMIKELTYDLFLLEPLLENCPSSIPTPLENLKCLTLRSVNICLSEDILFTLCLLGSAPNLQNLTIDLYWQYGDRFDIIKEKRAAAKLLKSEAQKHTSYNNLRTIKIRGMEGLHHKMLLIKLLQTRCPKFREFGVAVDDWSCSRPQEKDNTVCLNGKELKEGMAGGDKRIRIDDEVDRISELPVNLREHILDCLSITDAVATSVLCSKWRYCWTGLRKLKFNNHFWGFDEDPALLDYSKHARAIDRILMLHSGPIRQFTLVIPEIEHKNETVDINMWLRVLSNNGVQKIEIEVDCYNYEDNSFPIPSGLFHCRDLEKLSLRVCKLTLPTDFKGFANLTSLSLYHIEIAPSLLESLISGCLLLETLSLEYLLLQEPLALEALNLKSFYFDDYWLDSIIFKDTPKLTCHAQAIVFFVYDQGTYFCFFLLEPLPENLPSSTPTPLENLKCLTLRSVNLCLSKDILFTLCLLSSAPNLQSLTIDLHWEYYGGCFEINEEQEAAAKLLKSEAQKHTSYDSVQTLKITGNLGMPSEMLLIKLLQTRCHKVKKIIATEPWPWKLDATVEMKVQENEVI